MRNTEKINATAVFFIIFEGNQPDREEIKGPYPVVADQSGGGKGLVVQAYTMRKYLGYLNLTFDQNGVVTKYSGNPILLDSNVPEGQL
jgi:5'-nucleotidase